MPVLVPCRHRQQIALAIAACPAVHDLVKALPVAPPQPLRDDQVEAGAQRFLLGETEDAARRGVPEADPALGIGVDDGLGAGGDG